jgi:hypothetical protein
MSLWKDKNSQEKKECKERRRKFLLAVNDKPLKIQFDKYFKVIGFGHEAVLKEFETYKVENSKLSQFLQYQKHEAEIREKNNTKNYSYDHSYDHSYDYSIDITKDDPTVLSASKIKQYEDALNRIPNGNWYEKLIVRFYISTEWIIEDWARKNNLDYIDYNEKNPYSPQDCNVAGVDIDVKTTLSVGKNWRKRPYYTRNSVEVKNEVQVAVSSAINSSSDDISYHTIQGIFDPVIYKNINHELKFLSVSSNFKNPCYFHPLDCYFLDKNIYEKIFDEEVKNKFENLNLDEEVFQYFLASPYYLTGIFHSISDSAIALKNLLEIHLKESHYDFIPIILELVDKKSIYLLPHYLADYLIVKIVKKEQIDKNLMNTVFSIFQPNIEQKIYIKNLFKLVELLPEVRCKWHSEESIEDMEISFLDGHIPTFQLVCPREPTKQTTIYSYSWKTGQTVIYSRESTCSSPECGGLTHKLKDFETKQMLTYCKATCSEFGRQAHKSNNKY